MEEGVGGYQNLHQQNVKSLLILNKLTGQEKDHAIWSWKSGPGLGQAPATCEDNAINGILTLSYWISNGNT